MSMRPTRLIWIVIVPALIYAALKGFVYYKAKTTVDDAIVAAADQAEIHYTDISTDLRGIVTVSGITVQPVGYEDRIAVEAVRVSSDDPMFFVQGARWQPGENAPPPSMSFAVFGLSVRWMPTCLRLPLRRVPSPVKTACRWTRSCCARSGSAN